MSSICRRLTLTFSMFALLPGLVFSAISMADDVPVDKMLGSLIDRELDALDQDLQEDASRHRGRTKSWARLQAAVPGMTMRDAVYNLGLAGPTNVDLVWWDHRAPYMEALQEDPRMAALLAVARGQDSATREALLDVVLGACREYIEDFALPKTATPDTGHKDVAAFHFAVAGWAVLLVELDCPPIQALELLTRMHRRSQHSSHIKFNMMQDDPRREEPRVDEWVGSEEVIMCAYACWLYLQRYDQGQLSKESLTEQQLQVLAEFSQLDSARREKAAAVSRELEAIGEDGPPSGFEPWITHLGDEEQHSVLILAEQFIASSAL